MSGETAPVAYAREDLRRGVYKVSEAAVLLGVSQSAVYDAIDRNMKREEDDPKRGPYVVEPEPGVHDGVKAIKVGTTWKIPAAFLDALLGTGQSEAVA